MDNKKYLLLITVGPVQDFIAAARKLRDLWFGSTMLSDISKAIAKYLNDSECSLIFPGIDSNKTSLLENDSDFTVVNKILVESPEGKHPEELVAGAKECMCNLIRSYAAGSKKKAQDILKNRFDVTQFEDQIPDIGDLYAVWVPFDGDYPAARDKLEGLMAARKSTRNFAKPCWDGTGRIKSSLDGIRETVIKSSEIKGLLKKGELLDSIGVIKRFYPLTTSDQPKPGFDDLACIASGTYIRALTTDSSGEAKRLFECLKNKINEIDGYNSESLYKEDLKQFEAGRELIKIAGHPQKYGVILVGDGDHVGSTIDKIAGGTEQVDGIAAHKEFSISLSAFSSEVRAIVEMNHGSLIYAGGDDVMAYLPLDTALDCANEIQRKFCTIMNDALSRTGITVDSPPTFSAGLAIVHYSEALSSALELARSAERIAKDSAGRDAVAIIQNKMSGNPRYVYGKWGEILPCFTKIVALIKDNKIPGTLAYDLIEVANKNSDQLEVEKVGDNYVPLNALTTWVFRVIIAKESSRNGRDLLGVFGEIMKSESNLRKIAAMIILGRQFADAQNMAEGKMMSLT